MFLFTCPNSKENGGVHAWLWYAACTLRKLGVSPDDACDIMHATIARTPGPAEIENTVHNAYGAKPTRQRAAAAPREYRAPAAQRNTPKPIPAPLVRPKSPALAKPPPRPQGDTVTVEEALVILEPFFRCGVDAGHGSWFINRARYVSYLAKQHPEARYAFVMAETFETAKARLKKPRASEIIRTIPAPSAVRFDNFYRQMMADLVANDYCYRQLYWDAYGPPGEKGSGRMPAERENHSHQEPSNTPLPDNSP